jgi:alpha-tubulin suppressor-like RCC1 family protein
LDVRIYAFGPLSPYLNFISVPKELKPVSRRVAKIALGEMHVVFLFAGGEVGVCGSNEKGQLGLPIKYSRHEEKKFISAL